MLVECSSSLHSCVLGICIVAGRNGSHLIMEDDQLGSHVQKLGLYVINPTGPFTAPPVVTDVQPDDEQCQLPVTQGCFTAACRHELVHVGLWLLPRPVKDVDPFSEAALQLRASTDSSQQLFPDDHWMWDG